MMDKSLFITWNNFTRHQLDCQNRNRWLDVFLVAMLEHQKQSTPLPPFFRGMSSILTEQLFHDLSQLLGQMDIDKITMNYCLRKRGWILLNALVSSDLRSLTGAAELTDLLIRLYGLNPEFDIEMSTSIPPWPLSDLKAIISRSDCSKKKKRIRQLKRSSPRSNLIIHPAGDHIDGSPSYMCHCEDGMALEELPEEASLPHLPPDSFKSLILTLLERLVSEQGDVKLKSSQHLDQSILNFGLGCLLHHGSDEEQRRLLRLVVRSMVSIVQHHRPLAADEIIQQLTDMASSSQSTLLVAEVVESLVRFLAAVHPIDDAIVFHQWLNSFHSPTCLRLIIRTLTGDVEWIPLIGTIIVNVSGRVMGSIQCHHHQVYGRSFTDSVDHVDRQSCSISSLFYILLQIYRVGNERSRIEALKTMATSHPCCCLPADVVFQILFDNVVELPEFFNVMEIIFRSAGFASQLSNNCHYCRNNSGKELDRCRRMGVYASTESLSQTGSVQTDPWRSFDRISDYILKRMDQPFSSTMIHHLAGRIVAQGTEHVQLEMWSRIFFPVLAFPSRSESHRPERSSIPGQITEASWKVTVTLIRRHQNINELFLNSNGLDLLLDYCQSPEWSSYVAGALHSLILKSSEAMVLSTFENLLLRFTQSSLGSDDPSGCIKTASALWGAAIRLSIESQSLTTWIKEGSLIDLIEQTLRSLGEHLSNPSAHHWNLYFDLLESLLTISFLVDLQVSELILTYFTPQNNLSRIYEAILRCATLERWSSPEYYPEIRKNHNSDGYEADEEPLEATKDPYNGLNLFFPAVIPQLLLNFNSWYSKPDLEKDWLNNFSAPFTRMAALCCHPSTASVLHEFDLLDLIFRDLKSILSSSLRNQLLSMVSSLGHYKILPSHLRSLFQLFKESQPPWKDLLPVLLQLIRQDGQIPTHSLPFPDPKGPAEEPEEESLNLSTGSVGSFVQVNDIRWEIHALAKNAKELGRLHETKGIGSAWSNAAVFLPILADPNWNMQTDGLAVSLWAFIHHTGRSGTLPQLRPDLLDRIVLCGAKESRNVHLFSVGNRNFLIEFWADPVAEKTLLIRVSQSNHSGSQTLASAALDIAIPSGRWNHMVFNCRQKSNGCNRTVNIQLILNGCITSSVEIKSPIPSVKRMGNQHSFLLLGTVHGGGRSPVWSLSNSTLFKGELPSVETAALLTALGPNGGVFLSSCLDGEPLPNFTHYLQPRWIQRLPNLERVLDPQSKLMDQLRTRVLLTYSAHDPASVYLYPCIISPTTGLLGSILPAGYVFNAVSSDPRSCQQPPIALSVATASPLSPQLHSGIRIALKQLGGYPILLFLLGHSVESSADLSSQAGALEILIEWLRSDPQEMRLFSKDGFWMLQHLFQVELCSPGKEFAAVLLNASCSGPVVNNNNKGDVIIVDPNLLAFTIQCWKHWQRHPGRDTLDIVLLGLQHLLRDNHPHRQFNVKQMERANVLQLLLDMAKEMSLYQEYRRLTEHQAAQVADIVEGLLGSPPKLASLTALMDYLLLLHPAALSFAQGSACGSYFTLSNRDLGVNLFGKRDWKLPDGFEPYASKESIIHQPMDADRLGSALRDVIVKWSDGTDDEKASLKILAEQSPKVARLVRSSSRIARSDPDIAVSLHFLRILTACIRVLPDSMVKSVVGKLIRPDVVVVMAHHNRDRMRAAAVRLLQALLSRSDEEEVAFIRQNGLLLLTNQLQPYAATQPVVEACLGLCVSVDVVLEQVTDPFSIWPADPTPFQLQSTILLLGLLPNAALDPALFHQLATLIRVLISSNSILKFLLDFGLVESLIKSVIALAHASKHSPEDVLEQREDEILMESIYRLLALITSSLVNASGAGPWSMFQDMIHLLNYSERVESGLCGPKACCVRMLRECGCVILKQALQAIQLRAEFKSHLSSSTTSLIFSQQRNLDRVVYGVLPQSLHRKARLDKAVGQSEALERFRNILVKAVDHITLNAELNVSAIEVTFSQELLLTLVRGLSSILERPRSTNGRSSSNWSSDSSVDWSHYYPPDSGDPGRSLFWNSRNILKAQLNRMLLFLSSPIQDPSFLYFVIRTLHEDPRHEDLFRLIPANESDFTYKLDTYLCHFLHSRNCAEDVEYSTLIRIHCISRCLVPYHPRRKCQVLDLLQIRAQLDAERKSWWIQQEEIQTRILSRYDLLTKSVAETAAKWTVQTVDTQQGIRRIFQDRIKKDHGSLIQAVGGWKELTERMTHPRACWHFPESYYCGWQLDPTEGHQRMRLRLERCALQVEPKYLLGRSQSLLHPESVPPPLDHVLGPGFPLSLEDLGCEKILRLITDCHLVTTTAEIPADIILTERWMAATSNPAPGRILYEDVREMLPRRFQLQDRALELFLADRRTVLIVFNGTEERNSLLRLLNELCGKLIPTESLAEVTQLWREHQITNFEYLVYLNKIAGRSFNDLMQYPIFPFVLADYESAVLNLDDPRVYRNFKKPMAVQNDNRDHHYIENYNYLKRDFENRLDGAGPNFGPFHYGSLYSNPGIVLHFLVRLPPFTKLLMDYQDRSFDVPDRSFHSVGTSWRLASSDSTTDVKELIPEFFYLPEFLVNSMGFDFGMQQSGDAVDDVQLPAWSQGKPRLFIQIHRQALESSWVRDHLHHWIDLIFGFKQTGPAAVESINVFHPSTYAGFDAGKDTIIDEDPIERSAKLTMIRSYGQVPRQLFRQPHPMSVQPLGAHSVPRRTAGNLLTTVDHLQWGCYVGSPACLDPVLKYKESFSVPVQSFLPLRTGDTYALGPFTTAIVSHSYDKDSFLGRPTGILGVALVLWGQSDGIVRLKTRKDEPLKPLIMSSEVQDSDSVVLCCTAPDYQRIWVAYRSGLIRVHPFHFDPLRSNVELTGSPAVLTGHTGPISQLILCPSFSLAVSAGSDGSCILWDLHRLIFIRQFIPNEGKDSTPQPVVQLAFSKNTADIACAVHLLKGEGSLLELRTVNGALVGSVTTTPLITSLCFSSAPEGISINVLAAGLSNGHIRLWDTWTLNPVREIATDSGLPIVGIAYSTSSQHLLAARSDGILLVWDAPGIHNKKTLSSRYPPFINLTMQ